MSGLESLRREMAFLAYVSAAHAAATPVQREELRRRVQPLLPAYKRDGNQGPVRAVVRDVMPTGWTPEGEWAEALAALEGQ